MKPVFFLQTITRRAFFLASFPVALASSGPAETSASGEVSGRVLNAATKQYVFNAEIKVEGTNHATYTDTDGSYRLSGLSAGSVTIVLSYPGYNDIRRRVVVRADDSAKANFELAEPAFTRGENSAVVQLDAFVVASEFEGNSKAFAAQRASLNMRNVVASDNFGPMAEGNAGEFMKYLPGIVIDYADTTARSPRLAGLDPKYAAVTLDGVSVASGTSAGFGSGNRSFEMDNFSGSSIEAVEVNKTLTADMDANAPAGSINMRSKNAFERGTRRINYQISGVAESYSLTLNKTPGPGDNEQTYKIKPSLLLDYSDVYFGKRLGVQVTLTDANTFDEGFYQSTLYDYSNATRGPVIRKLTFRSNIQTFERTGLTFNADLKVSPRLTLSWRSAFFFLSDLFNNREWDPTVSIGDVTADSTLTRMVAKQNAANTNLTFTNTKYDKFNNTVTYSPRFDYRGDTWTLGGIFSYSRSDAHYESGQDGFFTNANIRLTSMSWAAERPSTNSTAWSITQLSGRPWSDPTSYNRDTTFTNNIVDSPRAGVNQKFSGALNFTENVRASFPITLKAGIKSQLDTYSLSHGGAQQWTYVGPTKVQTAVEAGLPLENRMRFDPRTGGNISQQNWPVPDRTGTYSLFIDHPDYFTPDTYGNFMRAFLFPRTIKEQVDAAYLMADARYGQVRLFLGGRVERTRDAGKSFDQISAKTIAATRPDLKVNTVPYLSYQYHDGVRSTHHGSYQNEFLSGGMKYKMMPRLDFQLSFSQSILRPDYGNLAGAASINDANLTATLPNPMLKPEQSTKYFSGFQYYLPSGGVIGVGGYIMDITNKQISGVTVPASELGDYGTDPDYQGYTFISSTNDSQKRVTKGVEIEYNQRLSFLPGVFSGLNVFANMTRVAADQFTVNLVPKSASGGVGFHYKRFDAQVRATWNSARVTSVTTGVEQIWLAERTSMDANMNYQLRKGVQLFISGRNVLREPWSYYSNEPGRAQQVSRFGGQYTFGLKGGF